MKITCVCNRVKNLSCQFKKATIFFHRSEVSFGLFTNFYHFVFFKFLLCIKLTTMGHESRISNRRSLIRANRCNSSLNNFLDPRHCSGVSSSPHPQSTFGRSRDGGFSQQSGELALLCFVRSVWRHSLAHSTYTFMYLRILWKYVIMLHRCILHKTFNDWSNVKLFC